MATALHGEETTVVTIMTQYTPEQIKNRNEESERRIVASERRLDQAFQQAEHNRKENEKNTQLAEHRGEQLKMATFLFCLNTNADFKRFAAFCGHSNVLPRNYEKLKKYMTAKPAVYLPYCEDFIHHTVG